MARSFMRTIASISGSLCMLRVSRLSSPSLPLCRILLYSKSMASSAWLPHRYPQSRRSDHIDTYISESTGKVAVHDPYHWLEHPSQETDRWVSDQEQFTRAYLDASDDRNKLVDAIRTSTDYPKASLGACLLLSYIYIYFIAVVYGGGVADPLGAPGRSGRPCERLSIYLSISLSMCPSLRECYLFTRLNSVLGACSHA
jgi:hypothetical protein